MTHAERLAPSGGGAGGVCRDPLRPSSPADLTRRTLPRVWPPDFLPSALNAFWFLWRRPSRAGSPVTPAAPGARPSRGLSEAQRVLSEAAGAVLRRLQQPAFQDARGRGCPSSRLAVEAGFWGALPRPAGHLR